MVATAAVRHAGNGTEFLANVESIVGVAPRLISGEEEGRLSFIGAQQQLPLTNNPQLIAVIDIGGGSTEIAVGSPNSTPRVVSIPYGARSLTEKEIHSDPPRPEELTNAIGVIIDEVDDVLREIPELADCDEIIGDRINKVVTWNEKADLSELSGKPVRINFIMKDADLFAIQFK